MLQWITYTQILLLKGDVGGQLGLFVGASIITLCEIITYFCDRYKRDRQGKRVQSRQSQIRNSIELNMTNSSRDEELTMKQGNSPTVVYNANHDNTENENPAVPINGAHNNPVA